MCPLWSSVTLAQIPARGRQPLILMLKSNIKQMVQALKNCQLMFEVEIYITPTLNPDYFSTWLFSDIRRNNECMFASFWSGVMRLLTGNYFLVFILILFTFPLQSCLLSKSFEIKLIYFTVYSNSMSCFAESFKPFIHKSLFTYTMFIMYYVKLAQYYWLSGVSWRMMMGWTGWILTETFIYFNIMWDG